MADESPALTSGKRPGSTTIVAVVLALFVLVLYAPVRTYDFVDFDDDVIVTENPHVLAGLTFRNIWWALTTIEARNWLPVAWWSHMLDVSLFGLDAGRHHVVSAGLHAFNAVLLFLLLRASTGELRSAAFAAAVFALHPLRVESVAWITERKDVLSTAFWLLATLAYVRWCRRPLLARYVTLLVFFIFGLMAKSMLVTLPCTLLLLDAWPLGRAFGPGRLPWKRLLLEKAPLFASSVAVGVVTWFAQSIGGAVISLAKLPPTRRIGNAVFGYGWYLAKFVWPSRLAVPYFLPERGWPLSQVLPAAAVVIGGTAIVLILARRRPYLPLGWFWYLGTLAPVSGLTQVSVQGMADRFTYVPLIGIAIALAWTVEAEVRRRLIRPAFVILLGLAVMGALAAATRAQLRHWKDTESLFSRTLAVDPENFLAHNNLGLHYAYHQRWEDAAEHYRRAISAQPGIGHSWYNLGIALEILGRPEEAAGIFETAVRTLKAPGEIAAAHVRLSRLLSRLGRDAEAKAHLEQAVAIDPTSPSTTPDFGGR